MVGVPPPAKVPVIVCTHVLPSAWRAQRSPACGGGGALRPARPAAPGRRASCGLRSRAAAAGALRARI